MLNLNTKIDPEAQQLLKWVISHIWLKLETTSNTLWYVRELKIVVVNILGTTTVIYVAVPHLKSFQKIQVHLVLTLKK